MKAAASATSFQRSHTALKGAKWRAAVHAWAMMWLWLVLSHARLLEAGCIATDLATGEFSSCALLDNGRVKCWGSNQDGVLGLGDTIYRGLGPGQMGDALPFVDLGNGANATAIRAGAMHTCALLRGGRVKCWGTNSYGQLGLGDAVVRGRLPEHMGDALPFVDLGTSANATAISAGGFHTCALLRGGRVKCWGANMYGQLGLGDTADRGNSSGQMGDALPYVDLGNGVRATAISAGSVHTCALLEGRDLRVKCWGYNGYGRLGLGDPAVRGSLPGQMGDALPYVDLGNGTLAAAISAGSRHTCAVLTDGRVKCWGQNNKGQLGLGDAANRGDRPGQMGDALPHVDLGNATTAVGVTSGGHHTCALLSDGRGKCWGDNGNGMLGLGDTIDRGDRPGQMGDALPYVDLGTGALVVNGCANNATCALLSNGSVKCWGQNNNGQLGLGDMVTRGDRPGQMGDALPYVDLGCRAGVAQPSPPSEPPPIPALAGSNGSTSVVAGVASAVSAAVLVVACLAVLWWWRRRRYHQPGPPDKVVAHPPTTPATSSLTASTVGSLPSQPADLRAGAPLLPRAVKGGLLLHDVARAYKWISSPPPDAQPWQQSDNGSGEHVAQLTSAEVTAEVELVEGGLMGTGATAVVYQCLWPKRFGPSALLAAKVLKDPASSSAVKSFAHEARVLAQLRHPNVVRMYGYCLDGPCTVIIMELLPTSLRSAMYAHGSRAFAPPASLPWPHTAVEVLQVALDVARGVEHLHSRVAALEDAGISKFFVHRDLKPGNVLIDCLGRAKLSDFGLARPNTSTNAVETENAGTLRYMAPEVMSNRQAAPLHTTRINRLTDKVDIYGLGIIMWELVAKQVPWTGMLDVQVHHMIAVGIRPPFVQSRTCATSTTLTGWQTHLETGTASNLVIADAAEFTSMPAYTDLISRCWQSDPEQRPPARQVVQELQYMLLETQAAAE